VTKDRSRDEVKTRYAESALISAIRLRRHWMSQGLPEDVATDRALSQAVGMMFSSGVPLERLIELFDELQGVSQMFKEGLKDILKREKRERILSKRKINK
jgi:hypothetical protein